MRTAATCALFLVCILAANFVTTHYGMVPVGFGLTATAGTYLAGCMFILRDAVQDRIGPWVLAVIGAGVCLSFLVASPQIAMASAAAFACSELVDLAIYTPLRARGYIRAAVASNVAGVVVDTFLFLYLSGFPVMANMSGQLVGKLLVTLVVVAGVATWRMGPTT